MFELNGEPVALDFLQGKAKEYNMDFNSYINKMESKGLKKIEPGKITPPKEDNQGVPAGVNATPEIQPTVTELPSGDISLDLQDPKKRKELNFTYSEEQKYLRDKTTPERLQPISKEKKEEILSEYDKVSTINIEQETKNKIASKLKRFEKGVFKIEEKEEFNYWKDSKGDLFESSKKVSSDEFEQIKQTNQTLFLNDLPSHERVQIYNEQKNIYENEIANLNKKFKNINELNNQIENIDFSKVNSQEDFIYKNNLINLYKAESIDYNRSLANLNKKDDLLDDFKRDYTNLPRLENALKTTATDLAMGPMFLLDLMKTEEGKKISYTKDLIDYRESLAEIAQEDLGKPIKISDVNSWDGMKYWVGDATINFIPSGLMAASGGAAMPLFFASGFGSKISDFELNKRNAVKKLPYLEESLKKATSEKEKTEIQKEIDLYNKYLTVDDFTKLATATIHGAGEMVFERLTTVKLFNDLKNAKDLILKDGFKQGITSGVKSIPFKAGLESFGEGLTQITQNFADINIFGEDKSYFQDVDESMAQGFLIGNGFALGNTGVAIRSGVLDIISTKKDKIDIQNSLNKINKLKIQLLEKDENNKSKLSKKEKIEINSLIANEVKKLSLNQDITSARFLKLNQEQQQEVFEIDRKTRREVKRWNETGASKGIDNETKGLIREEISKNLISLQKEKNNLLESSDKRLKPFEKITEDEMLIQGDLNKNSLIWDAATQKVQQHNKTSKLANTIETIEDNELDAEGSWNNKTKKILLNKTATAVLNNPNAPIHEYTHALFTSKGFTKEEFDAIENDFIELLNDKESQGKITTKEKNDTLERYNKVYKQSKDEKLREDASEELLTIFGDAINDRLLNKKDETFFKKLANNFKSSIAKIVGKQEADNFSLNTAEDAYNMVVQFQSSVLAKEKIAAIGGEIPEEINKEVEKFSRSQKASDEVQRIYEEQGTAGAMDIISQFKPIVDKLVNKYRDVPGFEYELLKDEIETGKRGILDMIMEYTPGKAKGAPLAGYINTFLSRRAIEAANRILKTDFELDVTEAKGVTDTVTTEEIIEEKEVAVADEIKSLRKEIGLSEELVTTVKDAVIKTFGTKLPNPQDPKFRLELQKRFRTELKKPMAKFVGKQADYESFLRDNFKAIYDKLPQSLINRRFKDFAEPVLDENGKQLRERTAEGKKIFTKKKITPAEFIKYFLGSDVGRSTQGTRKTAIVEAVAEEIAFDATMEVLNLPEIAAKYEDIINITGEVLPENFKSLIAKQIDRAEDFKFSKTSKEIKDIFKNEYNIEAQEAANILNDKDNNYINSNYPLVYLALLEGKDIIAENRPKKSEKNVLVFFRNVSNIINDNKKIEVIDKKITADDASRVDHFIKINSKKTGFETKLLDGRFGQISINFEMDENGKLTYNINEKNKDLDIVNILNNKELIEELSISLKKYLDEAKIISNGKENPKKSNDIISAKTAAELRKKGFMIPIQRIKQPLSAQSIQQFYKNKEKDGYKGDYVLFQKEDNSLDIYSFGDDILNLGAEELNGVGNIAFRLRPKKRAKGYALSLIAENRLPQSAIKNKTKLNIKTPNQFAKLLKSDKIKFSKSLNREFNEKILQATTGVKWFDKFSPVDARIMGKGKGRKFFIPYSADDFVGLLYTTLGTKKQGGNEQMEWYRENLLRPFSRGIQQYEAAKQNALREWQLIKKEAKKDVPGGLNKKNDTGLTNQESVRIFIWNEQGMEIPGASNKLINDNLEVVKNNPKLQEFAERLMALNPEGYPEPSKNWDSGDITTDIVSYINDVKRSEFLTEFKENAEEIFSDQNKQKLRALYGDNYIEALDDILFRMTTGTNRRKGASKVEQQFMNWTNNSVGAIMFFNARSAVLQTLSAVNFINFSDNNPINAAIAFGKQKQYWNDFSTLFNSNFLKQRRTGLQTDVNADEIARAAKGSKNTARAALSALLKFGFTPTQIADSFAIASGGATFYRNRIKTYLKEGLTQEEAETKAFTDFQEIAEETQQSARPDRISLQQASSLGRLVLAFANTPMQYARLTKKATLDLINGRGDWKTNVSKIAYYSVIQNIIFSALQQGLFALLFDDEDDDKEKSRLFRIGNSSIDTLLRGIGVYGAAAATVKNMILEIIEQSEKSRPDYTKLAIEATSISPPINSKLRKLESAGKTFTYKQSKEKVFTEGFSLENPAFLAAGKVISAGTNLPADRVVQKADHIYTAMQPETELWQAIALSLGWSEWDLGMIENQTKKSKTPLRKSNARKTAKRKTAKRKMAN